MRFVDDPGEVVGDLGGRVPVVYVLEGDGVTVTRVRLDSTGREPVATLPAQEWYRSLTGVAREDGSIDLVCEESGDEHVVVEDVGAAATIWPRGPGWGPLAADLRAVGDRGIEVHLSLAPEHGIEVIDGDRVRRLVMFNGFVRASMTPEVVSVLPGGVLVFELRDWSFETPRGVYVASLETSCIARLCEGGWPVVVYEEPVEGWVAPSGEE
jgi:hypothetical protein